MILRAEPAVTGASEYGILYRTDNGRERFTVGISQSRGEEYLAITGNPSSRGGVPPAAGQKREGGAQVLSGPLVLGTFRSWSPLLYHGAPLPLLPAVGSGTFRLRLCVPSRGGSLEPYGGNRVESPGGCQASQKRGTARLQRRTVPK